MDIFLSKVRLCFETDLLLNGSGELMELGIQGKFIMCMEKRFSGYCHENYYYYAMSYSFGNKYMYPLVCVP